MEKMPGDRPPAGRQLDRPPSDRYAPASSPAPAAPIVDGSPARAVAFAIPAAVIAFFVYVGLAGPLAFDAGLVIVGIFAGRLIGLSARAGGGRAVASDRRVVIALVVTLVWFVAANVAVWQYAHSEGGVLPLLDYLLQAFGPVVPLVAIASVLAAWWSAR